MARQHSYDVPFALYDLLGYTYAPNLVAATLALVGIDILAVYIRGSPQSKVQRRSKAGLSSQCTLCN
jgi:hypothetical protein